jgi:hypothetical protein
MLLAHPVREVIKTLGLVEQLLSFRGLIITPLSLCRGKIGAG